MKDKEEFAKSLKELMIKHEVIITGCGCCNSPYLLTSDPNKTTHTTIDKALEHLLDSWEEPVIEIPPSFT